jgi:hypothetical protein
MYLGGLQTPFSRLLSSFMGKSSAVVKQFDDYSPQISGFASDGSDNPVPVPVPVERRSEPRYPTFEPAEIEIIAAAGEPIYGTIIDVSRSGLRLALPRGLNKGEQLKVKLQRNVIFGEVRYCRKVHGGFHAGLRIDDLVRPHSRADSHIEDDPLSLYAAGKGLSVSEVIEVREHVGRCGMCRERLAEKQATLNPAGKAIKPGRK